MRAPMRLLAIGIGAAVLTLGAWRVWPRVTGARSGGLLNGLPLSAGDRLGESVWRAQSALNQLMAGSDAQTPEARARRLRAAFDQIRGIDRLIPRDTFDVAAVAQQVGPDPSKLRDWVATHTRLVPYRGVLRGATGVLMDRVGNSLDRSLLLASLFKASGVPARLARAQLSDEAMQGLQRSATLLTEVEPPDLSAKVLATIDAYATQSGSDASAMRGQLQKVIDDGRATAENLRRRVGTQADVLARAVGHPDAPAAEDLEALRDHWWVQAQIAGRWVSFDPALADPAKEAAAPEQTHAPGDLPADLRHTIQLSVVVEKWDGSALNEQQALATELVPADLIGDVVRLQQLPMNWPQEQPGGSSDTTKRIVDAALSQHEWLPVFTVDGKKVHGPSILDTGELNQKPGTKSLVSAATGVFDALGGGESSSAGELTAEWIDYELRAPGEPPRKIRREVFDLIGPAARASGAAPILTDETRAARALGVLAETEILVLPAQLSAAFAAHQMASALLANESVLTNLATGDKLSQNDLLERAKGLRPLPGVLHSLAVARREVAADSIFITRPNVVSRHVFFGLQTNGAAMSGAIDIVASDVAASGPDPFAARIQQGVLDANLEAMFAGPGATSTATDEFGAEAKAGWTALRSPDELTAMSMTPDIRARVESDLRTGFVVVAPKSVRPAGPAMDWWRVDPRSGDTLRIGQRGWGQAQVEYKAMVLVVGVTSICFVGALADGSLSKREAVICIAVGIFSVGAALGVLGLEFTGLAGGIMIGVGGSIALASGALGGYAAATMPGS